MTLTKLGFHIPLPNTCYFLLALASPAVTDEAVGLSKSQGDLLYLIAFERLENFDHRLVVTLVDVALNFSDGSFFGEILECPF